MRSRPHDSVVSLARDNLVVADNSVVADDPVIAANLVVADNSVGSVTRHNLVVADVADDSVIAANLVVADARKNPATGAQNIFFRFMVPSYFLTRKT